jgi:hypothetical protein
LALDVVPGCVDEELPWKYTMEAGVPAPPFLNPLVWADLPCIKDALELFLRMRVGQTRVFK